jgi:hypothetical protein
VRAQFGILKRFLEGFDFLRLMPVKAIPETGVKSLSVRVLGEEGRAYAAYIHRSAAPAWQDAQQLNRGAFEDSLSLDVPAGNYRAEWIVPATGASVRSTRLEHPGGRLELRSPGFETDIALGLRRL